MRSNSNAEVAGVRALIHNRHFVVAILAIFVPPLFAWQILADADAETKVLVGANIALPLLGVIRSCARGLHPVSLIFFLFSLCWLGIAPLVQLNDGQAAWDDWQTLGDTARVNYALMLGVVMQAMVLLGSSITLSHLSPELSRRQSYSCNEWLPRGLALALLILAPIAIRMQGGIGTFFSSRNARDETLSASGLDSSVGGGAGVGFAVLLPIAIALTLAHLTLHELRDENPAPQRRELWALLVVALSGIVVFANPLSNTRFTAAVAFGSLFFAALQPRRRAVADLTAVAGLVTVVWVYPLLGQSEINDSKVSPINQLRVALTGADFDGFQQVVNTIKYVDVHGIRDGAHFLSSALFFVPRSVWPGKAEPATFEVSHNAGYWFTNLSLPLHAELYLDFGVIGVIVGCLLLGLAAGWLDASWVFRPSSRSATLTPIVSVAMLAVLRGPTGSLVSVYLPTLLLTIISVAGLPNQMLRRLTL